MSEFDNNYIDMGQEDDTSEEIIDEVSDRVGPDRGKDIAWVEMARFNDKAENENSVFYLDIRKYFTPIKCHIQ